MILFHGCFQIQYLLEEQPGLIRLARIKMMFRHRQQGGGQLLVVIGVKGVEFDIPLQKLQPPIQVTRAQKN